MQWFAWYSAMDLNLFSGRCGNFWEGRHFSMLIHPKDHWRMLKTLVYIHTNPKAAGARQDFYATYVNYGHYFRLPSDDIIEWSPGFLRISATLDGCTKHYGHCRKHYCQNGKSAPNCHWGSRTLKRLVSQSGTRSKTNKFSLGQQRLPWDWDVRLNQIPEEWYQFAVRFRKGNEPRDGDQALKMR